MLIGTSELSIGRDFTEEFHVEAIVWTEETGTIGLGGLPGANLNVSRQLSYPSAISADHSVVVGSSRNSRNLDAPFRWTRESGMEALADEGYGAAASDDGSVVSGWNDQGIFLWTRALGAVTIVSEPLAGDDHIMPLALSGDGTALVGKSFRADQRAAHLFVWTEASGVRAIENLPGYANCRVDHVTWSPSNGFVTAGACFDDTLGSELFVWTGQDRLMALGPTDALGGYIPGVHAVTSDGSVVVGSAYGMGDTGTRAYRWTEADGYELFDLAEGFTSGGVASMSADGSVVVGYTGNAPVRSFLSSASAGAVALAPLEGHDSAQVGALSADGSIAAGTSFRLTLENRHEDETPVYWRANGVPHRVADELAAAGLELGGGEVRRVLSAHAPLGFYGSGAKDELNNALAWRARLR